VCCVNTQAISWSRNSFTAAEHPETLSDACAYATLLDGLGRYDESEAIYQAALARFEELFGGEHLEIAVNLSNLAAVRWARGDAAGAEELYRRAAVMKGVLLGVSHPETALTLHNYASMLGELGRTGEARDLELKALAVFEAALDPFHPWRLSARALWERLKTQQIARASFG
jgi:tetratricopeptide (TPR) repeat protein